MPVLLSPLGISLYICPPRAPTEQHAAPCETRWGRKAPVHLLRSSLFDSLPLLLVFSTLFCQKRLAISCFKLYFTHALCRCLFLFPSCSSIISLFLVLTLCCWVYNNGRRATEQKKDEQRAQTLGEQYGAKGSRHELGEKSGRQSLT
jgi:hypothetical protein